MVRTHGAGGIGDRNTLNAPWIVCRHGLTLYRGDALYSKSLARHLGTTAKYSAQMAPFAHFFHHADCSLGVTEFRKSCFHGNTYGSAQFNGIDAEIIVHAVYPGDHIHIVDTAIAAMGPYGFVFGLFG